VSTLGFTNVYNIGGFMTNPGVRYVFPTESVPGQELLDLINRANSYLNNETFTVTSRANLATVIENAREVLGTNSTNILIDYVEATIHELTSAIDGLVLVADVEAARERLQNLINEVNELAEADFTPVSWLILQEALYTALEVLDSEDLADINTAFEALYAALDELVELPPGNGGNGNGGNGNGGNGNGGSGNGGNGNGGNQNLPQTGHALPIAVPIGGFLLILGLVIAAKDKKKFE